MIKKFIDELKRRNVIKSALAYLVVAWILLQVFSLLLPMVDAPDWVLKGLTLLLAIGLPVWIIVSWIYDITPQGIEKTTKDSESKLVTQATNKRLNAFIIASLSIAVIVLTLKITDVFSSDSDKRITIAILPFENVNGDQDDDSFSYGISSDIYTYFTGIKGLKVISLKSSMKYKDIDKTIPEIADELGVDYLVDGNVRKADKRVLISAFLIKANDEREWAESYDESEEHPFKIQQAVAKKIVAELKIKLSPQEEQILDKYPTKNMEAYNLFSQGRLINDSRKKEDLENNIELNKQAVALDSTFAEAYAEIGQSTLLLEAYYFPDRTPDQWAKKAMPYLDKALQLDPDNAMALGVRGMIVSNAGNWEEAKELFEKAVALNPNSATIRYQYARHAGGHLDFNSRSTQITISQKLDPLSPLVGHLFFANLINQYEIKEAAQYFYKYNFLFTKPGDKIEKESTLIAYKNKDWKAGFRFLETELKKDPDNAVLNRKLGEAYDGVFLDRSNYLKYTKKAYELDSTNIDNGDQYFFALLGSEKFKDAKKLMETKNFKSLFTKEEELDLLFWYYFEDKNYEKAKEILKDSQLSEWVLFSWLKNNASLGNKKYVDSVFTMKSKLKTYTLITASVYAISMEKDSMYYYLGKTKLFSSYNPIRSFRHGIRLINSWKEFDPYRKEERFKAILKKYYLPITHWNE